ncbi:hypothetical protein [Desulfoluna spongiiphila]|uniref:Uncharacterized protein n=1 Tax=Desulfoluna spongiiphila TaxID=419481 RepID=A0A1G5DHS1_9BACT|nr:hypothetical protein [Desulfoluna spongiiphila]SCY14166.1 hypothetical protein SAMN05216233_104195 [Desulfoluna spongiiphila]
MGDGRYYTFDQFYSVLFLTCLLTAISILGVISCYQGFKQKGRLILAAHATLGAAVFMRFAAEVVVSPTLALGARQAELACTLITECIVLHVMGQRSALAPFLSARALLIPCAAVGILFQAHGPWLIQNHSHYVMAFGTGYLAVTGGILLLSVAAGLSSTSRLRALLLFALPLGVHLAGAFFGGTPGETSLLLLYPFLLCGLHLFSTEFRAYHIGDQAFANITNLIDDAVILCDEQREIVYRNPLAQKAKFLKKGITTVPDEGPGALVAQGMRPATPYTIPVFSSPDEKSHISCRTQPVGPQENSRFFIFTDISRHIEMLDLQETQRAQLEEANQRLRQYSHIVFDLEKEKEVSALLSDVTHTQDTFIHQFRARVRALSQTRNAAGFNERLDALIGDAQANLSRIRSLVARYRRYHGT